MSEEVKCPFCSNDNFKMFEVLMKYKPIMINKKITQTITYLCNVCSKEFDYDHFS